METFLKQKFDEFNRQMFGGLLPPLPIETTSVKSYLGVCVYKKRRTLSGKTERYGFRIRINTREGISGREMEDTLIHEMIHYHIAVNGIADSSPHGEVFRKMMDDINRKYDRHLTISHKSKAGHAHMLVDPCPREHIVAIVERQDGTVGLKVLPRVMTTILRYYGCVSENKDIRSVRLFLTTSPFFNRFPCSGALKMHILDRDTIEENIRGEQELSYDGHSLSLKERPPLSHKK
ncbi:MAG: SprT-like domain-containing protein [Prevotella sp.]